VVVCAVRYEPVSEGEIPITGKNTGKNAKIAKNWRRDCQNPSIHRPFWSKTTKKLTGKKISITGKSPKITGKKYSFRQFRPSHVTMRNRRFDVPEFPPPLDPPSTQNLRRFCKAEGVWSLVFR
jgi:hypothetical protein